MRSGAMPVRLPKPNDAAAPLPLLGAWTRLRCGSACHRATGRGSGGSSRPAGHLPDARGGGARRSWKQACIDPTGPRKSWNGGARTSSYEQAGFDGRRGTGGCRLAAGTFAEVGAAPRRGFHGPDAPPSGLAPGVEVPWIRRAVEDARAGLARPPRSEDMHGYRGPVVRLLLDVNPLDLQLVRQLRAGHLGAVRTPLCSEIVSTLAGEYAR